MKREHIAEDVDEGSKGGGGSRTAVALLATLLLVALLVAAGGPKQAHFARGGGFGAARCPPGLQVGGISHTLSWTQEKEANGELGREGSAAGGSVVERDNLGQQESSRGREPRRLLGLAPSPMSMPMPAPDAAAASGQNGMTVGGDRQLAAAGLSGLAWSGPGVAASRAQLACPGQVSLREEKRARNATGLKWSPQAGRYLVAMCTSGQMSNRLRCLHKYLLAAALLRRTLVLPMEDLHHKSGAWNAQSAHAPYNFSMVIDLAHVRHCLGGDAVISLGEALARQQQQGSDRRARSDATGGAPGGVLRIDKVLCWVKACRFPGRNTLRSRFQFPKPQDLQPRLPPDVTRAQFVARLGGENARVLSLGDIQSVYFRDAPRDMNHGLAVGWNTPCSVLFKPHAAVVSAAEGFVREYTGAAFAALHLRRDDMGLHLASQRQRYWPLRQVAACVRRQVAGTGIAVLFAATDARADQVEVFRDLLALPDDSAEELPPLMLLTLPPMRGQFWARALSESQLADDRVAVASTEKLICAMALMFLFTPGSSFSTHIGNLRRGFQMPLCRDRPICHNMSDPELAPRISSLWRTTNPKPRLR